ncbi:MAG TPA: PEP-CTERM sorting domain-containing protein [Tepidisphaeraceae bacterium]
MKYSILSLAALAVFSLGAASASAQLLYSFETGDTPNAKDGFVPNGAGMTFSQGTTGATVGTGALKVVTNGGGYIGGYTTSDLPTPLTNPALTAISMDITISPSDPAYTGTFADLGVVLFVSNPGEGEYGDQFAPATATWANIDLAAGTTTITDPIFAPDPDTGTPESFATLLSEGWSVSGVQLTDSENGVQTFYVDNVQAVVPEPASISLLGAVAALSFGRRRKA